MRYTINNNRVSELSKIIKDTARIIDLLEENDPQYIAIKRIINKHGCNYTALAVIANALVSYQLSTRGEIYWTKFAEYLAGRSLTGINDLYSIHREFLTRTPYNRVGVEYKVRRLQVFYNSLLASQLYREPLMYCRMLDKLVSILAQL
jgi:DNA-(apurinic or apyrimidinic site) lyase